MENREFVKIQAFEVGEAVGDATYIVNTDGVVAQANGCCGRILGISRDDLIGKSIDDLWDLGVFEKEQNFFLGYDEKSVEELLRVLNEVELETSLVEDAPRLSMLALERQSKVCGITRLAISKKVVLYVCIPVFDGSGKINNITTVVRDLTDIIELKNKIHMAEKNLCYLKNQQFDESFVGESPKMRKIKYLIGQTAASDATVLIYGETGTGKEVVARELYLRSNRRDKPYICINCAAIPESLFESELFGYEKGAFTGALNKRKIGLLEMANEGTILLDEIEELPLSMQAKLLRVLQEKVIRRIGGTEFVKIDIRVIASTNRDLTDMIKNGQFREDLFYRLNVVTIKVPPLRERSEDVIPLAQVFLGRFNEKYKKDKVLANTAMTKLELYDWPGNVRDLEHTIERLVVIGDNRKITSEDVEFSINDEKKYNIIRSESLQDAVDEVERRIIENALKKYRSSRKAAQVLGVSQPTILRKAKKLGIHYSDWNEN